MLQRSFEAIPALYDIEKSGKFTFDSKVQALMSTLQESKLRPNFADSTSSISTHVSQDITSHGKKMGIRWGGKDKMQNRSSKKRALMPSNNHNMQSVIPPTTTSNSEKKQQVNIVEEMKKIAAHAVEKEESYRNLLDPTSSSKRDTSFSLNNFRESVMEESSKICSTHNFDKENLLETHPLYLPPHLHALKTEVNNPSAEPVTIPIMSQLSPRIRRKISQLPAPSEVVEERVEEIVKKASSVQCDIAYEILTKKIDHHNRLGTSLTRKFIDPPIVPPSNPSKSLSNSSSLDAKLDLDHSSESYYQKISKIIKRREDQEKVVMGRNKDYLNPGHAKKKEKRNQNGDQSSIDESCYNGGDSSTIKAKINLCIDGGLAPLQAVKRRIEKLEEISKDETMKGHKVDENSNLNDTAEPTTYLLTSPTKRSQSAFALMSPSSSSLAIADSLNSLTRRSISTAPTSDSPKVIKDAAEVFFRYKGGKFESSTAVEVGKRTKNKTDFESRREKPRFLSPLSFQSAKVSTLVKESVPSDVNAVGEINDKIGREGSLIKAIDAYKEISFPSKGKKKIWKDSQKSAAIDDGIEMKGSLLQSERKKLSSVEAVNHDHAPIKGGLSTQTLLNLGLKVEGGKIRGLTKTEERERDWERDPFEDWVDNEKEKDVKKDSPPHIRLPHLTAPQKLLHPSEYIPSIPQSLSSYEDVAKETRKAAVESINSTLLASNTLNEAVLQSYKLEDQQVVQLNEVRTDVYDSLSLDLDPAFTKRRLYGRATLLLVYYVNTFKLKSAWQHLIAQVIRINEMRRRVAGHLLTRVARGMLGRAQVKGIRHQLALLKAELIEAERRRVARENWARSQLAFALSGYVFRRRRKKERIIKRATLNIQRVSRGFMGRRKFATLMAKTLHQKNAATVIQCFVRQRQARVKVRLYQKIKLVDGKREKAKVASLYREWLLQRDGGALVIQRYYRAWQTRKRMKNMIYWHRQEMVVLVQSRFRGFRARKRFKRTIKKLRQVMKRFNDAATIIQCMVRIRISKRRAASLLLQKLTLRRQRVEERKAQRNFYYGFPSPYCIAVTALRTLNPLRSVHTWKAAIEIQRVWRGYRYGRRRRLAHLIHDSFSKAVLLRIAREKGVVKIQATWKGFKYRRTEMRKKRLLFTIRIQCCFRGYRARCMRARLKAEKLAGMILTKNMALMLRYKKAYTLRQKNNRLRGYAIQIQRAARMYIGRKLLHSQKTKRRMQAETTESVVQGFNRLIYEVQLRLLKESIVRDLGIAANEGGIGKPRQISEYNNKGNDAGGGMQEKDPGRWERNFSGKECIHFGPVQALFIHAVGPKARVGDSKSLISNQVNANNFKRWILSLEGLAIHARKKASGDGDDEDNKVKEGGKDVRRKLKSRMITTEDLGNSLISAIYNGIVPLPEPKKKLSPTELDIAYSSCKNDKGLGYKEFIDVLSQVAKLHYGDKDTTKKEGGTKERWGNSSPASRVSPSHRDRRSSTTHGVQLPDSPTSSPTSPVLRSPNAKRGNIFGAEASIMEGARDLEGGRTGKRRAGQRNIQVDSRLRTLQTTTLISRMPVVRRKLVWSAESITNPAFPVSIPGWTGGGWDGGGMGEGVDTLLVLICRFLMANRHDDGLKSALIWMEEESKARVGEYARKIQNLYRIKKAVKLRELMQHKALLRNIAAHQSVSAVTIQTAARRFIARRRVARLAQTFIIHYVPFERIEGGKKKDMSSDAGLERWYNPSTRIFSYTKPKVLLHLQSTSIALPQKGCEFVVSCSYCSAVAELNCLQCEDSFCKLCFANLHCKGSQNNSATFTATPLNNKLGNQEASNSANSVKVTASSGSEKGGGRRSHVRIKLPFCSNCKYQHATKSCLSCVLKKPVPGSWQDRVRESERGMFCDECFTHFHSLQHRAMLRSSVGASSVQGAGTEVKGERIDAESVHLSTHVSFQDATTLHKDQNGLKEDKEQLVDLLTRDLPLQKAEPYLINQQMRQRVITKHIYETLVTECMECSYRSASWRCRDCQQLYCHTCLIGLHSQGPFASHFSSPLCYYTKENHQSYLNAAANKNMHTKMQAIMKAGALRKEEEEKAATLKLQTWWRMVMYGKKGKLHIKVSRRRLRRIYFARKRDKAAQEKSLSYYPRALLGLLPELFNDTMEDRVLKRISMLNWQRARQYIYRNKQFPHERLKVVKKKAHEDDEHDVNATNAKGDIKYGFDVGTYEELVDQAKRGGFRIGKVITKWGKNKYQTISDMSKTLLPNTLIRIGVQIMKVVRVTTDMLYTTRRWRGDKGEYIVYRLPTPREEFGLSFQLKYYSYFLIAGNPLLQSLFRVHNSVCHALSGQALKVSKTLKRYDFKHGSHDWKVYARVWVNRAKWSEGFIVGQSAGEGGEEVQSMGRVDAPKSSKTNNGDDVISRKQIKVQERKSAGAKETNVGKRNAMDSPVSVSPKKEDDEELFDPQSQAIVDKLSVHINIFKLGLSRQQVRTMISEIKDRAPGTRFTANALENEYRKCKEELLSLQELASFADDYVEDMDVMTGNVFWVHKETHEVFSNLPGPLKAKQELENTANEEKEKKDALLKATSKFDKKTASMGKPKKKAR